MKLSVNWLRELCATDLPADDLARRLTFAGFEVEGREERTLGKDADVVSARVTGVQKIAGSDHLTVCQVDDGRACFSGGRHGATLSSGRSPRLEPRVPLATAASTYLR